MLFQEKNPCPHGRLLEITKGKGVFKAKLLKGKYEAKLDFPARWGKGGGGSNPKNPSMGGGGESQNTLCTSRKYPYPQKDLWLNPPPPFPGNSNLPSP